MKKGDENVLEKKTKQNKQHARKTAPDEICCVYGHCLGVRTTRFTLERVGECSHEAGRVPGVGDDLALGMGIW